MSWKHSTNNLVMNLLHYFKLPFNLKVKYKYLSKLTTVQRKFLMKPEGVLSQLSNTLQILDSPIEQKIAN